MLIDRLGLGQDVRNALWHAYESWDGTGAPNKVKGDAIHPAARVVHIANQAVPLDNFFGRERAIELIRERSGRYFDPRVVDVFLPAADSIFDEVDALESPWDDVIALEPGPPQTLEGDAIDVALEAVGQFADLKSIFTAGNAAAVADLAVAAAERCNCSPDDVTALRRAAHMKDVGRVGVSSGIWDKEGSLTPAEWEQVRLHPYFTERILHRSTFLEPLGRLGSMHHERPDASGYHRSVDISQQTLPTLILQAADRYSALISRRPHRDAMTPAAAAQILRDEAKDGKSDPQAVDAVLEAAGHPPVREQKVAGLTPREVEVLDLLAQGFTTKEIARMLSISRKTCDNHIQNIYSKTGVSTRAAATLFAMQSGILGRRASA
jgi:HD-GYP domain-containing protein (c-di-GMP phosphodiesterase class II)